MYEVNRSYIVAFKCKRFNLLKERKIRKGEDDRA